MVPTINRRLRPRLRLILAVLCTAAVVVPLGLMWRNSLLPDSYDMASMGTMDLGGGVAAMHHHGQGVTVASLVGDTSGEPDVHVDLTASREGANYLVNGTSPGPEVHATQGQLVEVTLHNENVADGITLHWHGMDVPNAMDGVAGVTQDAVMPGKSFTYRFVATDAGTYWYHSHQVSHEQVRKGLFGPVVIEPLARPAAEELAVLHRYGSTPTLNGREGTQRATAQPGEEVRVRVINTDNALMPVWVSGAPYRVLAVDGTDLNEPGVVDGDKVIVTAGARVDLGITVPPGGARVEFGRTTALVLGTDPTGGKGTRAPVKAVDFLHYGEPTDPGLDASHPDRRFEYRIGRKLGFLDGRPGWWWSINGKLFPDTPMYVVSEGDVAVVHLDNQSGESHPMHLHGHHLLVLSRDGRKSTGSPWWVDSLEAGAGESYDVAFRADNPGIWMDHCHNLPHAAEGLVAHLMYEGVTSSYEVGGRARNEPE